MEIIGRETVYDGKFLEMEILNIRNPDGKESKYESVRRKNNQAVVSALVENVTNNTFVLVEQFRAPVNKKVIELVAGVCDKPGFSKTQIITEEIIEETGYTATEIIKIIENSPKSPGMIAELGDTFYAKVIGERGEQRLEDTESIEVLEFEKKDLNKFLKSKRKEGILISSGIYTVIGSMLARGVNILE